MTEKMYWYWFTSLLGLTRQKQGKLIHMTKSAKEFYVLKPEVAENYLNKKQMEQFLKTRDLDKIQRSYERLEKEGIQYILNSEPSYPKKLLSISDFPYGIFRKGEEKASSLSIAIVGSRKPSMYGIEMAEYFAEYLSSRGITVVSGLALGVDSRAHLGAVRGKGNTIGVLGCGINKIYPYSNQRLYQEVLNHGCIYSEYGLDVDPLAYHFPQRNRIISGLCDGVLVIEAKKKSGSLITVDCALDQNKDVFAIPGNINNPLSQGCNHLIAQGAKLIEGPEDILSEYPNYKINRQDVSQFPKIGLDREEEMVYDTLSFVPRHMNEIFSKVNLSIPELYEVLFYLEKKGYITQTSRNYYIKKLL